MKNNNTLEFGEEFYEILRSESRKHGMSVKSYIKFLLIQSILDETNKKYEDRRG